MIEDWENGYKIGYAAGYEAAMTWKNNKDTINPVVSIHDSVPITPDGLSYEEIYGSVIYQQNKKKEND